MKPGKSRLPSFNVWHLSYIPCQPTLPSLPIPKERQFGSQSPRPTLQNPNVWPRAGASGEAPVSGICPTQGTNPRPRCHPTHGHTPWIREHGAARLDTSGGRGRGRGGTEGSWGGKDTAQQPRGSSKGTPAAVEVSQVPRGGSEAAWGTWECVSCLWASPRTCPR